MNWIIFGELVMAVQCCTVECCAEAQPLAVTVAMSYRFVDILVGRRTDAAASW